MKNKTKEYFEILKANQVTFKECEWLKEQENISDVELNAIKIYECWLYFRIANQIQNFNFENELKNI